MSIHYPKTKRGDITFKRILDAADEIFYKKGYYRTSINEITTRAEVALGSFYTYFDSKYDVYKYLLREYSHEIRSAIAKKITPEMERREAERVGIREFLIYVLEHPQCYHIIWESLHINEELFMEYYQTFAEKYVKNLQIAESKNQIISGHNLEVLAFLLMGATNFIGLRYIKFSQYLKNQEDERYHERIDKVVDDVIFFLENGIFEK